MNDTQHSATPTELGAWIAFGIAAVIYVITFALIGNAGYGEDTTAAAGWMTLAGTIAGLTLVPAIILTGIRQLVPALRGVPRGE